MSSSVHCDARHQSATRRPVSAPSSRRCGAVRVMPERRARVRPPQTADDRFFRHLVSSMRNGVIAFRRDGTLALMNDEAYRIFGLTPATGDIGRPFADVLRERPEIIRVLIERVRAELPAEPRRAAAEGSRSRNRLHDFARQGRNRRRTDWRGAVLQGSDPRRAARGAASGCAIGSPRSARWPPGSRTS